MVGILAFRIAHTLARLPIDKASQPSAYPPKATTPWGKIPIKEKKEEEEDGKDIEIR